MQKIFEKLNKHRALAVLFFVYLVSCVFSTHYLYNWDSGQFALATKYFALELHQPHPPGYPLFIFFGHLLTFVFGDLNFGFVLLNWLAGGLAVWFFFRSTLSLATERTAFWLTLLFVVNPVFWFDHNGAMTYTFEVLGVCFGVFMLLESVRIKQSEYLYLNAVMSGILIGFRPSAAIVLLIILLSQVWALRRNGIRQLIIAKVFFILAVLSWFLPFLWLAGAREFFASLGGQYASLPKTYATPVHLRYYLESIALGFNFLWLLVIFSPTATKRWLETKYLIIWPVCLLMVLFYYLSHFGNVAYIVSFLPTGLLLLAPLLEKILSRRFALVLLIPLVVVQVGLFFRPVGRFQTREVRLNNYRVYKEHDRRLQSYLSELDKVAESGGEVIAVSVRGQYYNAKKVVKSYPYDDIRVLSYYAPQTKIYDLLGVRGIFFVSQNYWYNQYNNQSAIFPHQAKKMLVLADYLHQTTWPRGLPVTSRFKDENTSNYYVFDISKTDKFNLLGTDFVRAKN